MGGLLQSDQEHRQRSPCRAMPVELATDPECSLEALQARFASEAPAVEFIEGDAEAPVLAVLSQKDVGCVILDVSSGRIHGWSSHGGHSRLHKQMEGAGFCLTRGEAPVTSWHVKQVRGGTDPMASCSIQLESADASQATMMLTLHPFVRIEVSVPFGEEEATPVTVQGSFSFVCGAANPRGDGTGPVKLQGLQGQAFMDLTDPDPESKQDMAEQLNCRPGMHRSYTWQPRPNKQTLTMNLQDGPDALILKVHSGLAQMDVRGDPDSERWPNFVTFDFATQEPILTTEAWSTHIELKSRY